VSFGARARIRRSAIRHNLEVIQAKASGARVIAVIKANAYGHGMLPVAEALSGADCLAVARMEEARVLRRAGIDKPILLLGGVLEASDLDDAVALDLAIGVHNAEQVRWLETRRQNPAVVWLKIDTGMNRLGFTPAEGSEAMQRLRGCVADLRLMTHFSSADDPRDPATNQQLDRFLPILEGFAGDVGVANSAGLFAWAETLERLAVICGRRRLWVRPGLALYGISPFADGSGADLGLKPAMQLEATVMSVKKLAAGERVGYGGSWHAEKGTQLGIIAAGYGDGYTRCIPSGTPILLNGRRVAVVGRISMDLTAVDLGRDATDQVGDLAILWGDQLPVEEVARYAGMIPYQLVTGVLHREKCIVED
jgi:alanine racemase